MKVYRAEHGVQGEEMREGEHGIAAHAYGTAAADL